ncbi:DUF2714 domain-containing protein [Mycoplasma sp. E35C]|uniref:DUF2714 domain-containing protein n=1 Tax=Mycoplasma sp. E35C TaxID=2801918 RepID=UPI001CA3D97B|nr:DUF2714 domain-containing protein [Mycoplasma sp. E35C]QZX49124.1 DUF2714 domain-containing protein [Mycoplasma sp. E35C]
MKKKQLDNLQPEIVNKDYISIVQSPDFVEFAQLFNTTLLQTNTPEESPEAVEFLEKMKVAIMNRYQIIFDDLVISWTRNVRFSWNKLVPVVVSAESSQTDSINLTSKVSDNPELKKLTERFNLLLNNQLFEEHKIVEVIDGIVVYISKETNQLKVVFSQGIINA